MGRTKQDKMDGWKWWIEEEGEMEEGRRGNRGSRPAQRRWYCDPDGVASVV